MTVDGRSAILSGLLLDREREAPDEAVGALGVSTPRLLGLCFRPFGREIVDVIRQAAERRRMRLLVAVDGSSVSDETLEYAIDIADALDADVTVCHVVEPALFVEDVSEPVESLSEAERRFLLSGVDDAFDRGLAVLDEAVEFAAELGRTVDREIRYGDPATEVTEFAESDGFDAIYVGHRGRSTREERFLGSVAKGVVERSTVPVTVVR